MPTVLSAYISGNGCTFAKWTEARNLTHHCCNSHALQVPASGNNIQLFVLLCQLNNRLIYRRAAQRTSSSSSSSGVVLTQEPALPLLPSLQQKSSDSAEDEACRFTVGEMFAPRNGRTTAAQNYLLVSLWKLAQPTLLERSKHCSGAAHILALSCSG